MDTSALLDFLSEYIFWVQIAFMLLIVGSLMLLGSGKSIKGKLAATLPRHIPVEETRLLYRLTEADLKKGIRGIKHPSPCLGYFLPGRIVLSAGPDDIEKLTPKDTTITLIVTKGLSSQIPLLIRINSDGEHSYIAFKKPYLGSWDDAQTQSLFERLAKNFPHHTLDQFQNLHQPNRFVVAGLFAACIAGLGLLVNYMLADAQRNAPQVLTELGDGSIVAFSRSSLYELSKDGALLSTVELATLGLDGGVSDAAPMSSGDVLVADSTSGFVKRCSRNPWMCEPLSTAKPNNETRVLNAFAVTEHPQNGNLFVADSGRHRVLELNAQGEYLGTVLDVSQLCFPNKVWIKDDRLLVVNTNWHNILEFGLGYWDEPTNRWTTVKEGRESINCPIASESFSIDYFHRESPGSGEAIAHDEQTEGSVWPMDAGRDSAGNWWVLNAKNGMKDADLVKLNPEGEFLRVALSGTDPIGLVVRDNDVLVVDMAGPKILQVLNGGEYLNDFGDARFQNLMAGIDEQARKQEMYYYLSIALIAIPLIIACLLLMYLSDRRLRWVPTA